jgi:basic membrane lipoprotein Med (substrate-binding protein (PBP1-ABC) superfamily)
MFKKNLIFLPILLLVFATAFPQGRGGSRGRSQGQGQGQRGNQGVGQSSGQGQYENRGQGGSGTMEQKRVHATQQQRKQIQSCNNMADGIRKQAREMAQVKEGKFNAKEAIQQQNQIRNQLQNMEKEHAQLMNGLDPAQNQAWQEQIRNMNQFRQQLNVQMQHMDDELGSANPDAKRVGERAREMEQIMKNWRKEYNTLSSQAVD